MRARDRPLVGGTLLGVTDLSQIPAGLASELLLDLGLKPVVRELHDAHRVQEATQRWREMGYEIATGEVIREDTEQAAMVTDSDAKHTVRPLARHPVIDRAVALGGPIARAILLHPKSPIYRKLCAKFGADEAPLVDARPRGREIRERQAIYVSADLSKAQRAKALDRMAADTSGPDGARELGALLGYPACCVDAFASLERRWPNRVPLSAAAERSQRFEPRLNNAALDRFAWIAWFPCSFDCEASSRIADAAAIALSARDSALVEQIDHVLALPRVVIDDLHQAVLTGARRDGARIEFDELIPLDSLWPPTGDRADLNRDAARWRDLRSANALVIEDGRSIFYRGRSRVSGSGEPPLVLPFGLD
jgi:hypothetical protein